MARAMSFSLLLTGIVLLSSLADDIVRCQEHDDSFTPKQTQNEIRHKQNSKNNDKPKAELDGTSLNSFHGIGDLLGDVTESYPALSQAHGEKIATAAEKKSDKDEMEVKNEWNILASATTAMTLTSWTNLPRPSKAKRSNNLEGVNTSSDLLLPTSPPPPPRSSSSSSSPSLSSSSDSSVPVFRLVLLLPESDDYEFNSSIISIAVETALTNLNTSGKTSGFRLRLAYGDSQCSEILGPIRAFEFFWQGLADAYLGPFCDYSAAPVARYSAYWRLPVITAGALSHDFVMHKQSQYRTLTRVGASTVGIATLLTTAVQQLGWKRLVNIYDAQAVVNTIPKLCYLASSAIVASAKGRQLEPTPVFWDRDPEKLLRQDIGTENAGEFPLSERDMGFSIDRLNGRYTNNKRVLAVPCREGGLMCWALRLHLIFSEELNISLSCVAVVDSSLPGC